jgi:hypothetical protein
MYRYSYFTLTIDSELELPGLAAPVATDASRHHGGNSHPDVVIRLGSVDCSHEPATIGDEIAFPRYAGRFHIKRGREIVVDPHPEADPGIVRTLLLGRVMACLLRQRGYLPLHASAVAIEGRGVLFLGASGAGKSTTAAALYVRGHQVLADDVGAVRAGESGIEVQATWSGLRLLDDSRKIIRNRGAPPVFQGDKHVFHPEETQPAVSFPLKRIYFLDYGNSGNGSAARTDPIRRSSAVALLNSHSFLRTWRAGNELRQINLDRAGSIAAAVPLYRLVRERSLDSLPGLAGFVEKDVASDD